VAAVEGPAIAGGTEILQATDVRVAGESARFGVSEARWGLFPLGGSAVRLVRQIPYTLAAEILLTGRHLTAREALDMGLIGHVVPDGEALTRALEIAETIAANGPLAVRAILQTIRESEGLPEDDAFALEAKLGMAVFASEDAKEGPRAFKEKRRPEFRGR
jgi:enoyl-CoA hydratase